MVEDTPAQDSERAEMTKLRIVGKPEGEWHYGRQLRLRYISANVKNVGRVTAERVSVVIKIPGGERVELNGPESLEPNEKRLFSAKTNKVIIKEGKLKGKASCYNCRR